MEYGLTHALKGFFGSADAKTARNQQLSLLQQMYNQDQAEKNQAMNLDLNLQEFHDKVDTYSQNIIQGQGIRENDLHAYKMLNQDARKILEEKVRKAGGIVKFMQGGGSQALQDYKNAIVGSDIAIRLGNNQAAFRNILLATQNLDENGESVKTSHLVPQTTLANLSDYQAGKTDHIVWNGLLSEYDLSGVDAENVPVNQQVDAAYVFSINPMNKALAEENMEKDLGITREMYTQYAVTDEDFMRQNELFDRKLEEYYNYKQGTKWGQADIEVHLSSEVDKVTMATVESMPQEIIGYDASGMPITQAVYKHDEHDDFKVEFNRGEGAMIMEDMFGYERNWNTTYKNSRIVRNVGRVFTNYEDEILSKVFGDAYSNGILKGETQRSNDGWFIGGSGAKIGAGQTHRGQTLWTQEGDYIADRDDTYFQGITIAQKVTGFNPESGQYEEFLVTDNPDDPTDLAEDFAKFDGLQITPVYIAEFYDVDALEDLGSASGWYGERTGREWSLFGQGMSDVYYKEIDIRGIMPQLEKDLDINTQISQQRTDAVLYNRQKNVNKKRHFHNLESLEHQAVIDIVGEPFDNEGNSNMNKIYMNYVPQINTSLNQMFGPNRSKNLDPHLFTFMFDQAMKTHPETYHNRVEDQIGVLSSMEQTDLLQIVKTGNVGNFYTWLDNNGFDSKTIKENTRYIKRALFDNDFILNDDGTVNYKRRK